MARGARLKCPPLVVMHAQEPYFKSRQEAWAVVGPILARLLAQTIMRTQAGESGASSVVDTAAENL
jgi:hypothetical protein